MNRVEIALNKMPAGLLRELKGIGEDRVLISDTYSPTQFRFFEESLFDGHTGVSGHISDLVRNVSNEEGCSVLPMASYYGNVANRRVVAAMQPTGGSTD